MIFFFLTGLLILSSKVRRNENLWFDWISWTKTAEFMYKSFYQKSAFPSSKQEQTHNIAAGFFMRIRVTV